MPSVRNDGEYPVFVEDIRIRQGQTVEVPDHKWKAFNSNDIAKRTIAPFLKVVAKGKGKGKADAEPTPSDPDAKTLDDIFTEMLEQDPEKEEDSWWTADGKPDARELSARAERPVKAPERNKAWASYNADPDANGE